MAARIGRALRHSAQEWEIGHVGAVKPAHDGPRISVPGSQELATQAKMDRPAATGSKPAVQAEQQRAGNRASFITRSSATEGHLGTDLYG